MQSGSVQSLWNTVAGGLSTLATQNASGAGTYYTSQSATNLFDKMTSTKYASRGNSTSGANAIAGLDTGFHLTVAKCSPTLTKFRFATGDTGTERDPMTLTIEGTDCGTLLNCTSWTLLYNGTTGLDTILSRNSYGTYQTIQTPQPFTSYRFLITSKRNSTNSIFITYSEIELYGY